MTITTRPVTFSDAYGPPPRAKGLIVAAVGRGWICVEPEKHASVRSRLTAEGATR